MPNGHNPMINHDRRPLTFSPVAETMFRQLDATALDRLADFFDQQAREARAQAADQRARARITENLKLRRQESKKRLLEIGALAVATPDRSAIVAATGLPHETVNFAAGFYRRTKLKDKRKSRDLEIWKAHSSGQSAESIASIYSVSARRIRQIIERMEHRLNAPKLPGF